MGITSIKNQKCRRPSLIKKHDGRPLPRIIARRERGRRTVPQGGAAQKVARRIFGSRPRRQAGPGPSRRPPPPSTPAASAAASGGRIYGGKQQGSISESRRRCGRNLPSLCVSAHHAHLRCKLYATTSGPTGMVSNRRPPGRTRHRLSRIALMSALASSGSPYLEMSERGERGRGDW